MNKYLLTQLVAGMTAVSAYCVNDGMHSTSNNMHSSSQKMNPYEQAQAKMITPSAAPVVKGGADVFFNLDFIYWTARQEGQSFAWANSTPDASGASNNQTFGAGQNVFVNSKYSPGFKIGLGTVLEHDGWDLFAEYTWYKTSPKSSTYSGYLSQAPYLSNLLNFSDFSPAEDPNDSFRTGSAAWKLRFNDFKVELGRNYYISQKLQLRNHIGLRGGWQIQRLNTAWTLTEPTGYSFDWTQMDYWSKNKNYYWTIGVRSGLDSSWMFTQNWSIYGDMALSALWTEFTYTRKDFATTSGSPTSSENVANFQTVSNREQTKQLTPVLELALGVRFDWWFNDDDYRFRLQAGWENQVWFNTNRLQLMETQGQNLTFRNGNLSLQGLTIEARFDF